MGQLCLSESSFLSKLEPVSQDFFFFFLVLLGKHKIHLSPFSVGLCFFKKALSGSHCVMKVMLLHPFASLIPFF